MSRRSRSTDVKLPAHVFARHEQLRQGADAHRQAAETLANRNLMGAAKQSSLLAAAREADVAAIESEWRPT